MIEQESSCGNCCTCCTTLSIKADDGFYKDKPAGETCEYVANNQCSIHEDRFSLCRKYECFWLQLAKKVDGGFPVIWRPDNLGIIITPKPELEKDNKIPLYLRETYKGANDLSRPELKSFLDTIVRLSRKQKKEWEMYLIPFDSEGYGRKLIVN